MTTILTELRSLAPRKTGTYPAALIAADEQADALLRLTGVASWPVPDRVITDLPRVRVERVDLGDTSGATQWSLGRWVILINRRNIIGRQRFSLFHEFKHVLDHDGGPDKSGSSEPSEAQRAATEQACDYFAACALMPRAWVEAAWHGGMTDPAALARTFQVSAAAMRVRLRQIGLDERPVQTARHQLQGGTNER